MNIISVDLPWKSDKRGRRALAIADLDRHVRIALANDDDELLALVRDNIERESIVLLDIPIEGCEQIEVKKFRPVDRALARQGIWIQPASGAGSRGKVLKERIQNTSWEKKVTVQEIYPYAIYKFLAYLKDKRLVQYLKADRFDVLLDNRFRAFRPPKYKREKEKCKRLKNMRYLYSLLTDSSIGLIFSTPL